MLREAVLKHHDSSRPTRIETDSSGYAVGAFLDQEHTDALLVVAYVSRMMTCAEWNYPIQEQELLALIYALKNWRHYLFEMEIIAYTDYSYVATWETNRELNVRETDQISFLFWMADTIW